MAAFAISCRVLLLVLNAAALPAHRRLLFPLPLRRRRLLRDAAKVLMVLGASALFHAVAAGPDDDGLAAAGFGFLMWVAGVALLLLSLTPGRFPGAAARARLAAQLVEAAVGAFLF